MWRETDVSFCVTLLRTVFIASLTLVVWRRCTCDFSVRPDGPCAGLIALILSTDRQLFFCVLVRPILPVCVWYVFRPPGVCPRARYALTTKILTSGWAFAIPLLGFLVNVAAQRLTGVVTAARS